MYERRTANVLCSYGVYFHGMFINKLNTGNLVKEVHSHAITVPADVGDPV